MWGVSVSDDVISILFKKLDKLFEGQTELKEDVAVLKAMHELKEKRCDAHNKENQDLKEELSECNKELEKRVDVLEKSKSAILGIKNFGAWLIVTGIAVATLIKEFFFK